MEAATARFGRAPQRRRSRGVAERRLARCMISPSWRSSPSWRRIRSSTRSGSRCTSTASARRGCRAGPALRTQQLHRRVLGPRSSGTRSANTFVFTGSRVTLELCHRPRDGDRHARGVQGPGTAAHRRARAVGGAHGRHARSPGGRSSSRTSGSRRRSWMPSASATPSGSARSRYALVVMILADVWKTAPFMALLLLAGLQVIPDESTRPPRSTAPRPGSASRGSRCRC